MSATENCSDRRQRSLFTLHISTATLNNYFTVGMGNP